MKRKQVHIGYLQDDILLKLMASTGSYEDLLRNEATKYDQFCTQIAQNIEEQGNSCYKFRFKMQSSLILKIIQLCG